ncbi:PKD domain-containing protein [Cellulomonas sp. KRMCY2]|uniref:PKD domain-containing protein n=1 Tax=Cellulomonas sp. KRMCY2 TaxID=1304865 RepID=UPI000688AA86|nr:PKD domain-containing protein [Cellulomonas sp. KRMCY2]
MGTTGRRVRVAAIVAFACVVPNTMAWASTDGDEPGGLTSRADGSSVVVTDSQTSGSEEPGTTTQASVAITYEYRRVPLPRCGELDPLAVDRQCIDDLGVAQVCADGSVPLAPLQRREVDPVTGAGLSPWSRVDPGGCQDGTDLVVLSVEEFRRLPLTASTPQYQPDDGRGLVNKDLIVYADPAPQTLATTVLGVPVAVRATPVAFAWDFGDGSEPLVTTDPGAPYPNHTVSYPYRQAGEFAVQLVTTWQGQYQVNGAGPWYPVAGTAATTSVPFTAQVFEAHAHLVADDLGS